MHTRARAGNLEAASEETVFRKSVFELLYVMSQSESDGISAYEKKRLANIRENVDILKSMGIYVYNLIL